jgi:Golgi SNAP receptor complex protein 2
MRLIADRQNRNELLGISSATGGAGPSGSAMQRRTANGADVPESPFGHSGYAPNYPTSREDYALREHSFIRESENLIDGYIAQGTLALQDLVEQRGILKKTHRKLLDAAHTLGVSRETIGWVERRT